MRLDRRTFLQRVGLGILTLGLSETYLASLSSPRLNRYLQAIAEPTRRKLALLVGINQYPRTTELTGCVTDVELQRELLQYRFGFQPQDILTLTNEQATREKIETAFLEHLIAQAKEGDIVVFHFSGYGSQVKLTNDSGSTLRNSLVPVDNMSLTQGDSVNEILETTLALLARSLSTRKVTLVLDTSYQGINQTLQGNLRVRSCPNPPAKALNSQEIAFQEKLLSSLASPPQSIAQIPGVVLAAAKEQQFATETKWTNFSAGLFTYALTQTLWHVTSPRSLYYSMARTDQTVARLTGLQQQPQILGRSIRPASVSPYFLSPESLEEAEGVITKVEENGKVAHIQLVGLPISVLESYSAHSRFQVIEETSENIRVELRSREGLKAKARLISNSAPEEYALKPGQQVKEVLRVIKRNPGLIVALDGSLERIERVDATSAFANIDHVSSVVTAGEQSADCLFGRIEDAALIMPKEEVSSEAENSTKGYGLFSVGRDLIPNTIGSETEAVKSAINRLVPKLKTLLATKLLRLTLNEGSSRLPLGATLERIVEEKTQVLIQREIPRLPSPDSFLLPSLTENLFPASEPKEALPNVPVGAQLQYKLHNYSDKPIYLMLVGIDSGGNAIALYSPESTSEADASSPSKLKNTVIPPQESLILPQASTSFNLIVPGPGGLAEIYLIGSHAPFKNTLEVLSRTPHPKGEGERIVDISGPLEVAQALLQDLHQASAVDPELINLATDVYAWNVSTWATLGFTYQVI